MALLVCEGFETYGDAEYYLEHSQWVATTSDFTLSTEKPRTGTYSLRKERGFVNDGETILDCNPGSFTMGVGFAVLYTHLPEHDNDAVLVDYRDSSNGVNTSIVLQSDGRIAAISGDVNGTFIADSNAVPMRAGRYHYVECMVFSGVSGTITVRVDGVEVLATSGNTYVTGNNSVRLGFCGHANKSRSTQVRDEVVFYDDIVVFDDTGSDNNTFIGDVRVETLKPNADTATADWTAISGSGYENIDDATIDATTFLYSGSASDTSEFDIGNLSVSSGTIPGIMVSNVVYYDDSGTRTFQAAVKSSGSTSSGSTHTLSGYYQHYYDVFENDPNSGVAFTVSDINSLLSKITRVS